MAGRGTTTREVKTVWFDQEYWVATFWPALDAGVELFETLKEATYKVGDGPVLARTPLAAGTSDRQNHVMRPRSALPRGSGFVWIRGTVRNMAEALVLNVEARDPAKNKGTGSRSSRKLRKQGRVPAILYGHKQDPLPISLSRDDVDLLLKKQAHLTELKHAGGVDLAIVRDADWDHLGKEVIHLDFIRVDPDEAVLSDVLIELHGDAPAVAAGGLVEPLARTIRIRAKPKAIPRSVRVEIGELSIGDSIHARDMIFPEGVTFEGDPDILIVHAVERKVVEEPVVAAVAEPAVAEKGKAVADKAKGDEKGKGDDKGGKDKK